MLEPESKKYQNWQLHLEIYLKKPQKVKRL